jgi:hypothetical protein
MNDLKYNINEKKIYYNTSKIIEKKIILRKKKIKRLLKEINV